MKLSTYQEKIILRGKSRDKRAIAGKKTSVIVDAVAGSGKSTTSRLLMEALIEKYPNDKIISIQFAKAIAEAMNEKLKEKGISSVTVKTAHAAGMMVLSLNGIRSRGQVQSSKYFFMSKTVIENNEGQVLQFFLADKDRNNKEKKKEAINKASSQLTEIVRMVMATLTKTDDLDAISRMIDRYDVTVSSEFICRFVHDIITEGMNSLKKSGVMGYEDMIYAPLYFNVSFPQYNWVMVDECQDLNEAQLQLVMRFGKTFFGFGDVSQAIMGWAGSLSDGMERFKSLANAGSLPLSICYRCDKTILDLARILVPHIEAREDAGDGMVKVCSKAEIPSIVQPGDFILCRITSPLVSMCINLIKNKIGAKVKGRDIGKKLNDIYESIVKCNPEIKTIEDFIGVYAEYCQEEMSKAISKKTPVNKIALIQDQQDCINVIAGYLSNESLQQKTTFMHTRLGQEIETMFEEYPGKQFVTLSTIHKSKGLEAKRVFIIDFEKMPFKFPNTPPLSPEQAQQEKNLIYVAVTRAEQELYIQGNDVSSVEDVINKLTGLTSGEYCPRMFADALGCLRNLNQRNTQLNETKN